MEINNADLNENIFVFPNKRKKDTIKCLGNLLLSATHG